jgi:hypothetical protein
MLHGMGSESRLYRVSQKLKLRSLEDRAKGFRAYQQAAAAGIHQSVFSSLMCDIRPVQPDDPRVKAIARVLNVDEAEAFEPFERPGRKP